MTPELKQLEEVVFKKRHDGQLDAIREGLATYLQALDQKEADEARKHAWFYQIKRWLKIN
uniref:Uncharacterized protein n=1 Tax=Candidatus Desulfatibia profunda TaxID=2841695 RepID=A0A8J6NUG1_9BACT|nr:hypothetical protein [Candidatus Desulfatibia profunda]